MSHRSSSFAELNFWPAQVSLVAVVTSLDYLAVTKFMLDLHRVEGSASQVQLPSPGPRTHTLKRLGFQPERAAGGVPPGVCMMGILQFAIIALVVSTGYSASAQQFTLPDAPSQSQHKFFDRQNKVAFGTLAALIAVDSITTQRLTNSGRAYEANPIWRPMVRQGWAGQAAAAALGYASALGLSYTFHKTGHHKLERWANWVMVGMEGANDVRNVTMDATH